MKIRHSFVSNSSSSSFVVPKKVLSDKDYKIYRSLCETISDYDSELHETSMYIYGRASYHNEVLQDFLRRYVDSEGADILLYE